MENERKKLMAAAVAEFSRYGPARASLESIAERAKLEVSVARALFVDKEGLFREVIRESSDPLIAAIGLAVENIGDPRELIRHSLRQLDQWLLENEDYVRILQWSALEDAGSIDRLYEQSLFPSEFYERIEEYIEAGALRTKDPFTFTLLLDSLIFFSHIMRPLLEHMSEEDAEPVFERRFEAIMDLLDNGLFRA